MQQSKLVEEKQSYVSKCLPSFLSDAIITNREEHSERVIALLEQYVAENNIEGIQNLFFQFEIIYRTFGLKKDYKRKIFVILTHFVGQPYIYQTRNIFRQQFFSLILWILQLTAESFEEEELTVDWKHIYNMMEKLFFTNRIFMPNNVDLDTIFYFKFFLRYLGIVKKFFPKDSIGQIFQKLKEEYTALSYFTFKHYLKITRKFDKQEYWEIVNGIFQLWRLRGMEQYEDIFYDIITTLIHKHPTLPWHEHFDFFLPKLLRKYILLLPLQESKQGYQQRINLKFITSSLKPTRLLGSTLATLLVYSSRQDEIWAFVQRIFSMSRPLIHPNNQQTSTTNILGLYYNFLRGFSRQFIRDKKQKEKKSPEEISDLYEQPQEKNEQGINLENLENPDDDQSDDDSNEEKLEISQNVDLFQKVIDLFKQDIPMIIYLKDGKDRSIQRIVKYFIALSPGQLVPWFMELLDRAFTRTDLKYSTIISIIQIIIPYFFDRKQVPDGLTFVPLILGALTNLIVAHDSQQAYSVWRIFDLVLQNIPVYDLDDLRKEYPNLDDIMPYQDQRLTEDISNIVIEAFKKFVSLFEFLGQKKKEHINQIRTLFISIQNKFYNLIAQSSSTVFKDLLKFSLEYVSEKLQPHIQQYFSQLLQAFSQRDPKKTLETFMPFVCEKLLKQIQTPQSKPSEHLVYLEPIQYEFNVINQQTILYYVSMAQDLVGYAHHYNKQFNQQLIAIVTLCLSHEETQIFNQGLKLLKQIFLGLISIHPLDVSFRDDQSLDYKWTENPLKQNKKKFQVKWFYPDEADRKYLMELIERFYYPTFNNLLAFQSQYPQIELNSEYINQNFQTIVEQLNEPHCSNQLQQFDMKLRSEIARQLTIINELYGVFQMRTRQPNINSRYTQFFDELCFPELNEEAQKIFELIKLYFPLIVRNGLGGDARISGEYRRLICNQFGKQTKDQHNSQLIQIRQWINQKKTQIKDPISGKAQLSRFLRIVMAAYQLNVNILGIQFAQDSTDDLLQRIMLCFTFHEPSQKICYSYLSVTSNVPQDTLRAGINALRSLLTGDLFNKDRQLSENQGQLNQVGLFQKTIAQLLLRFQEFLQSQPNQNIEDFLLFRHLGDAYDNIIDKQFRKAISAIQVKSYDYVFKMFNSQRTSFIRDDVSFITPKDDTNIFAFIQRRKAHLSQFDPIPQEQKAKALSQQFIQYSLDQFNNNPKNIRNNIINGMILLYMPSIQDGDQIIYPIFQERVINLSLEMNISPEYAYRSFGRVLLFKLLRVGKWMNSFNHKITLTQEDFKQTKTLQEFLETRYFRVEEKRVAQSKMLRYGQHSPYASFSYNQLDEQGVQKTFQIIIERFQDRTYSDKFLDCILNDLQANDDNLALFFQQGMDFSNVFHDVSKYFNNLINGNLIKENVLNKGLQLQYSQIRRLLKKIFQITSLEFYKNTKETISQISQKQEDKDSQMLTRIYVLALLRAAHSAWPLPQSITREDIVEYSFSIIDYQISTQSRDQFQQLLFGLFVAMYDSDIAQSDYFMNKLIESLDTSSGLKLLRYIQMMQIVIKFTASRGLRFANQLWDKLIPLLQKTTDDGRIIQGIFNLALILTKDIHCIPIDRQLLRQIYGIEELSPEFYQIEGTGFFVPHVSQFENVVNHVVSLLRSEKIEQRKLAFDTIQSALDGIKLGTLTSHQYKYYGELVKFLLDYKEEDIESEQISNQISTANLTLSQLSYDAASFEIVRSVVQSNTKSSFYKTRFRSSRFLQHFLLNNLKVNKVEIIKMNLPLLQDEQKQVADQTAALVTFLIPSMSEEEQVELAQFFVTQSKTQEFEVAGKTGLIGMIKSVQNLTAKWSNEALRTVLSGRSRATYIKEFAASFQKAQKANFLQQEQRYPYEREIIERLAEFASPYNYFA